MSNEEDDTSEDRELEEETDEESEEHVSEEIEEREQEKESERNENPNSNREGEKKRVFRERRVEKSRPGPGSDSFFPLIDTPPQSGAEMFEKEVCYFRIASHSILESEYVMAFVLEDKIVHLNTTPSKVCHNFS